jgi:hypothetical protein
MNGAHDMGGMHGFGPVVVEDDEPVFHADWERTTASTMMALFSSGRFAVDQMRRNIELQDPATYLAQSYYERWLVALEKLLTRGLFSEATLHQRVSELAARPHGHDHR